MTNNSPAAPQEGTTPPEIVAVGHRGEEAAVRAITKTLNTPEGRAFLASHRTERTQPDVPRRQRLYEFTPAERAIWEAAQVVEAAGCDPRLTDALNLLHQARECVADAVDDVPRRRASITLSQTDSSLRAAEPTLALSEAVDAVNWAKSMMAHDGGETSTTADLASAMDGLDRLYLAYERLLKSLPVASSPTVTPPQTPTLGGQAATQRELKAWRWLHWGTAASWACPCGHAHGRAIQICEDCQTPRPAMAIPLDYGFAAARSTPTEEKTNAE